MLLRGNFYGGLCAISMTWLTQDLIVARSDGADRSDQSDGSG